jgi:hypothetical protein
MQSIHDMTRTTTEMPSIAVEKLKSEGVATQHRNEVESEFQNAQVLSSTVSKYRTTVWIPLKRSKGLDKETYLSTLHTIVRRGYANDIDIVGRSLEAVRNA